MANDDHRNANSITQHHMNSTRSWAGLPEHIKREAAPDMLAGTDWYLYGCKIEHPGVDELRRWVAENTVTAPCQSEARQSAHRAKNRTPKRMTQQEKRDAVDQALSSNVNVPDRELARRPGLSHAFIALRRRKIGNVAKVVAETC